MQTEYKGTVTAEDESHWNNGYKNGLAENKEAFNVMYNALIEVLDHTYDQHNGYSFDKLKDIVRAAINKSNPINH